MVPNSQPTPADQEKIERLTHLLRHAQDDLSFYQRYYDSAKVMRDRAEEKCLVIQNEIYALQQGQLSLED